MAFTMHSHSGQFCPGHAKDQLEDIIKHAISIGYTTMGLTEHMPRLEIADLYPEELGDDPSASLALLPPRHEAYLVEAQRLRDKYASQIRLLVGFEGEWFRPSYGPYIASLAAHPAVDYFIGSIHHVDGIPIDYDAAFFAQARDNHAPTGQKGTDEALFERYYDQQFEMLTALRPRVVGHFDLIRLLAAEPDACPRARYPGVWARVERNLALVREYGGILECNTSALRKGLAEPYPARAVAEAWLALGGRFTMSDDSHGVAQVATNYARAAAYLEGLGVTEVWTFDREPATGTDAGAEGKAELRERAVGLGVFKEAFGKTS